MPAVAKPTPLSNPHESTEEGEGEMRRSGGRGGEALDVGQNAQERKFETLPAKATAPMMSAPAAGYPQRAPNQPRHTHTLANAMDSMTCSARHRSCPSLNAFSRFSADNSAMARVSN